MESKITNATTRTLALIQSATDIVVEGIQGWDAPDYCDAFISEAYKPNGDPYTDEELDILNSDSNFVYQCVQDYMH